MKIYTNEKLIKRNNRIGQIASIISLVILGIGMYYSFKDSTGQYIALTFGSLVVGFLLFQFGNYYLSRWGKNPRPDQLISTALKVSTTNLPCFITKPPFSPPCRTGRGVRPAALSSDRKHLLR